MMVCPRCRVALSYGAHGGVTAHACGHCGGCWLDAAVAHGVLAPLTNLNPVPTPTPAACPGCGAAMTVLHTAAAGVEIDQCPPHGVWFDHDELVAVSNAVARLRNLSPSPAQVAYANWAPAAAVGVGAVGLAAGAVVAGAAAQHEQNQQTDYSGIADAVGGGVDLADGAVEVGSMSLEAAGGAAEAAGEAALGVGEIAVSVGEGAVEGAGAILEGVFAIFSLFEGL